jgi:hypothetical protein
MPGVHDLPIGEPVRLDVDAARAFVFQTTGPRVTPRVLAEAV